MTNWRRPGKGSRRLAAEAARVIVDHAAELGPTAMVLASLADESHGPDSVARYGWLPKRVAFVGVLNAGDAFDGTGVRGGTLAPDDALRGTGTLVALAPDFAACFVVRETGPDEWSFAITYDRDTVIESALPLIARMEPLERVSQPARSASAAITFESWPPCQASGDDPGSSDSSSASGISRA